MRFDIQPAKSRSDLRDVIQLEREVFHREKGIRLPELAVTRGHAMLQLIARQEDGELAGVLTALETTGDSQLHRRFGFAAPPSGRVARFTRLAVARHYRGLGLPLRLILASHSCFVVPNRISRTWLLFDAAQASSSMIANVLGFVPGANIVPSEYGLSRVLSRDEHCETAAAGRRRGLAYLAALDAASFAGDTSSVLVDARQAA